MTIKYSELALDGKAHVKETILKEVGYKKQYGMMHIVEKCKDGIHIIFFNCAKRAFTVNMLVTNIK